jgi:hypothetical protein
MGSTTWKELLVEAKLVGQREFVARLLRKRLDGSAEPLVALLEMAPGSLLAQAVDLVAEQRDDAQLAAALTELLASKG